MSLTDDCGEIKPCWFQREAQSYTDHMALSTASGNSRFIFNFLKLINAMTTYMAAFQYCCVKQFSVMTSVRTILSFLLGALLRMCVTAYSLI